MAEDVTDIIENISPQETQLFSGLQKTEASNTLHQFLEDSLATAADNAQVEGIDPTYTTITVPTRETNFTQIFYKEYYISETQRAVKHYGMNDPRTYQVAKKMKELAQDIELALMRGTRASGDGSTARRLDGVINSITTNNTAMNSGTTFTETILNDLINLSWNNTDEVATEIYVSAWLKRKISGFFTTSAPKYTEATDKRLVNAVDIYESDFAVHKIFKHRYVYQSGTDATGRLVMINPAHWAVAYLTGRRPSHQNIAPTGDAVKGLLKAELTLEDRAESGSVVASGFHLTS